MLWGWKKAKIRQYDQEKWPGRLCREVWTLRHTLVQPFLSDFPPMWYVFLFLGCVSPRFSRIVYIIIRAYYLSQTSSGLSVEDTKDVFQAPAVCDLSVHYRKGRDMELPDTLSRAYLPIQPYQKLMISSSLDAQLSVDT